MSAPVTFMLAVFRACCVEVVEALTIVLAAGSERGIELGTPQADLTRSWP